MLAALILMLTAAVFYLLSLWGRVYLKSHIMQRFVVMLMMFWIIEAGVLIRLLGG